MRLGMPALIEMDTVEQNAALCRELGLDFIELNANLPMYQRPDAAHFGQVAADYGVFYTIHLDDNMDVCDFNPRVAKAYTDTVKETIHTALEMQVPLLNMHLSRGAYFTLPEKKVYLIEKYRADYLSRMAAFREMCEREIGESGLVITVENTTGFTPVQQEAADVLLQSPVFHLNYDVGHNACTGGGDETLILSRMEKLRHMHLHDACPEKKQDHMTLGTGELDIPRLIDLMRDGDKSVVIEVKTEDALRRSVGWLRQKGIMA